jgi:two-component system cell cycle response regulator CtrA
MKILAAGLDEITIAFLRENGVAIEIEEIDDAEDLQSWLTDDLYDAGVINLETSGLGIYAARGLRSNKIATPLIGISNGSPERVWGDHRAVFLENGGDDLLKDPVNPRELVASLRAVTRRFKGALLDVTDLRLGDAHLKVNITTRTVKVNDMDPALTGKELAMMLLFASSPDRVWSKEMLLTQMYTGSIDEEPEMKIIDVFVCKLRKKLTDIHPDAGRLIETVWGRGYRLPGEARIQAQVA